MVLALLWMNGRVFYRTLCKSHGIRYNSPHANHHEVQDETQKLRIERFLHEMDQVVPWPHLEKVIQPHYKNSGGRPPHELRVMLRIHFLQLWHNLSDPLMEEALL